MGWRNKGEEGESQRDEAGPVRLETGPRCSDCSLLTGGRGSCLSALGLNWEGDSVTNGPKRDSSPAGVWLLLAHEQEAGGEPLLHPSQPCRWERGGSRRAEQKAAGA